MASRTTTPPAAVAVPLPTFVRRRPRLANAVRWSGCLHDGQRRAADSAPFVLHPLEVAAVLDATGAREDVLVAAVLHDSVEDTDAALDEIARRFGARVARLVGALTDDPSIEDWRARKAALRAQVRAADADAVLVFAADKLCRVRELRLLGAMPPEKLEHYRASLVVVADRLGEAPVVRLLRFELEALEALPPARALTTTA